MELCGSGFVCEADPRMEVALKHIFDMGFGETFDRNLIMNTLKSCSYNVEHAIGMLLRTENNQREMLSVTERILQVGS